MADRNQTRKKLQAAAKKRRRAPKGAVHAGEFVTSGTSKLHNIFARSANALGQRRIAGPQDEYDEYGRKQADFQGKIERMRATGQRVKDLEKELADSKKARLGDTKKIRKQLKEAQAEAKAAESKANQVKNDADYRVRVAEGQEDVYGKYADEPKDYEEKITKSGVPGDEKKAPSGVAKPGGDRAEVDAILYIKDAEAQGHPPESAFEIGIQRALRQHNKKNLDRGWVASHISGPVETTQVFSRNQQREKDDQTGDWMSRAESPDTTKSAGDELEYDPQWRYSSSSKPGHKPGTPTQQMQMMSPAERKWLEEQSNTEGSPYYQSLGRERNPRNSANLRIYAAARSEGASHEKSRAFVEDPSARKRYTRLGEAPARSKSDVEKEATQRVKQTIKPKSTGVKEKYKKAGGTHEDFAASIRVPGVDIEEIKKEFPDWTDKDLIQYERQHKQDVSDWLEKNERWAHEQRVANVLGRSDTGENKDSVVFFTTNVGSPAASVPANSLIGQYIIKKRKKMVVDERNAVRSEVKGEFPRAVRDQHLIEVSTGVSLGAQGRYGAFHTTGFKAGKKRSKGYGKQVPVGTQILRDKNNQPVYDKNGNLRYTEGYTRPFTLTTDRDVGLRIFIG